MADDVEALRRKAGHLVRSLSDHLDSLASQEYPTSSPPAFIDFFRKILAGFRSRLAADLDEANGKWLCELLVGFGHHVKFLETASYPHIPWALISPIEKLIRQLVPGARVILRSDWEYNYSIARVIDTYRRALEPIRTYFEDSVFAEPAQAWNIVSLPMIGHEIGHRLAEQFLAAEDRTALQAEISALVGDGKWSDPNIEKSGPLFAMKAKQNLYNRILELRTRGLQELVSDLVGGRLFGLSLLFGLREFSLADVLDTPPQHPEYYPPWRYRLRLLVDYLVVDRHEDYLRQINGTTVVLAVRDAAVREFEAIKALIVTSPDKTAINRVPLTAKAYGSIEEALKRVGPFLQGTLSGLHFDPNSMPKRMPELLSRIAMGIPPAEEKEATVDFRDSILAGALYNTAHLTVPHEPEPGKRRWTLEDDVTLCRLIHKALEFTNLASEFRDWSATRPHTNAK
jgi:hypothetical protein